MARVGGEVNGHAHVAALLWDKGAVPQGGQQGRPGKGAPRSS